MRRARRLHLIPPEPQVLPNQQAAGSPGTCGDCTAPYATPGTGTSMARRTGVELAAYDDVLLEACRAVDLPDALTGLPEGTERDAERLRLEFLLDRAGLTPYTDAA